MNLRHILRNSVLVVLIAGIGASAGHCQSLPQIIGQLSRDLHDSYAAKRGAGQRLAVLQFSSDPGDADFGAFLRASIYVRFATSKRFLMVTPEQVAAGLRRLGITPGGALSADDIHKVGAEIAADLLVVGEITAKGGRAQVTARLVVAATGEQLVTSTAEISKSLIPDQFLAAADVEQFRPPAFHPLHPDDAFQIAAVCRTRMSVDLQAFKAAADAKIGKVEVNEAATSARITYDDKGPLVAWVSLRGVVFVASTGSARDLASFRALDARLADVLESLAKLSDSLTKQRRMQLRCFGTLYFVDQPEIYVRGVFGYRDLGHFVMSGAIYFPPEMKLHGVRVTSLHRGWDGGFGFTFDGAELPAKTAKAGDSLDLTALATPGMHRFEASTFLAPELSGPQPGIGLLEISAEPSEKPFRITITRGPDIFWVPIGPISDVVGNSAAPPADKPGDDNGQAGAPEHD